MLICGFFQTTNMLPIRVRIEKNTIYIDFFLDRQLYVVIQNNHPSLKRGGIAHRPNVAKVARSWRRQNSKAYAETGHSKRYRNCILTIFRRAE